MPPWPLIAERTTTSSPCLTRGIQAARSPIFGAPPSPVWWHLTHRASTICSPVRSGAGAVRLIGSTQLPPDWFTMYVIARSISVSVRLALPPCGGICRMPLTALARQARQPLRRALGPRLAGRRSWARRRPRRCHGTRSRSPRRLPCRCARRLAADDAAGATTIATTATMATTTRRRNASAVRGNVARKVGVMGSPRAPGSASRHSGVSRGQARSLLSLARWVSASPRTTSDTCSKAHMVANKGPSGHPRPSRPRRTDERP